MKFIIETDSQEDLSAINEAIKTYMTWDNYKDKSRSQYASSGVIVRHLEDKKLVMCLSTNKTRTVKVVAYYES